MPGEEKHKAKVEEEEDDEEDEEDEEEEEGKEEEQKEQLPPAPPNDLWLYKPCAWDDDELHQACETYDLTRLRKKRKADEEEEKEYIPLYEIHITLVDSDGNPETTKRSVKANYKEDRFIISGDLKDHPNPILFVNYRYVTTRCQQLCEGHVKDPKYMVMLSVRQNERCEFPEDCDVFNYFIKPQSPYEALDIINFFQVHITAFFRKKTDTEDPCLVMEYVRPKALISCQVKVHWRRQRKTWAERRTIMVDPECVVLYRQPFADKLRARDSLFFWAERYRKTISKVSFVTKEKYFFLHSLFMFVNLYTEGNKSELMAAFEEISKLGSLPGEYGNPPPRRAFQDPKLFLSWLQEKEEGKSQAPQPKVDPVKLPPVQVTRLDKLDEEMNAVLMQFREEGDVQTQAIWTNIRARLEQSANDTQRLPQVDDLKLCQDPDDVDGLLRTVKLIKTELFENVNYEKALAITKKMKEVYQRSRVDRLREMMAENDLDILGRVHARGSKSIERPEPEEGQQPQEAAEEASDDEQDNDDDNDQQGTAGGRRQAKPMDTN